MKKILNLLLVAVVVFAFAACKSDKTVEPQPDNQSKEIEELKGKVKELEEKNKAAEEEGAAEVEAEVSDEVKVKVDGVEAEKEPVKKVEEADYTGKSFISLTSPNENAGFNKEPVTFTGKVSPNTEKIVVKQSYLEGKGGSYQAGDTYTLKDFKSGDETFTYKASSAWGNMMKGATNSYKFTAYFADGSTKTIERNIWGPDSVPSYLQLSSPFNGAGFPITQTPVGFKGQVSVNATKIVVSASGGSGEFYYSDVYTLKDFKHGDYDFVYRAAEKWNNLTFGENTYTFTAYFDDGTTASETVSIMVYGEKGA